MCVCVVIKNIFKEREKKKVTSSFSSVIAVVGIERRTTTTNQRENTMNTESFTRSLRVGSLVAMSNRTLNSVIAAVVLHRVRLDEDSLDESLKCKSGEASSIATLLRRNVACFPPWLRLLASTRPEPAAARPLKDVPSVQLLKTGRVSRAGGGACRSICACRGAAV